MPYPQPPNPRPKHAGHAVKRFGRDDGTDGVGFPDPRRPRCASSVMNVLQTLLATSLCAGRSWGEVGDWSSLWWLPEFHDEAQGPVPFGRQVAIRGTSRDVPHLFFAPHRLPPKDGWPLILFLHGQGESSGRDHPRAYLPRVAHQGPPSQAGRTPTTFKFAVLSPQKDVRSQFYDRDVAARLLRPTRDRYDTFLLP